MKQDDINKIAAQVAAKAVEANTVALEVVGARLSGMCVSLDTIIRSVAEIKPKTASAPASPPKCKDCRHCRPKWFLFVRSYEFARCARPNSDHGDFLVTGKTGYLCSSERTSNAWCGQSGRYFQLRQS